MEKFKVLLVDDEEDFVNSLSERLEMRDLESNVALNGKQALESMKADEPGVMVLDLKMPGMDGMEVLRRVREAYPNVQVIILTGHGTDKDEEEAKKLGAFAYLQKPVEMDRLVDTLRKAHKKFKSIKHGLDTALMAASMAQAGEVEMARKMMKEETEDEDK
jgi:DNA-binding NtrC family response regulator